MTDHLEQAAARAVELATEQVKTRWDHDEHRLLATRTAQHLAYLAGLLRGGAVWHPQTPAMAGHVYLSTGCLHDEHEYCRAMVGPQGEKRPGRCKFCEARCVCPCHNDKGQADSWGEPITVSDELTPSTTDPRTAARNFRASAAKVAEGFNPHSNTWQAGVRHGYLMAAAALDEIADAADQHGGRTEMDELRDAVKTGQQKERALIDQRDELLAVVKNFLAHPVTGPIQVMRALRLVIERIEAEMEGIDPYREQP